MNEFFILTGMFRSGTSLLSRMLSAHPQIGFAADLYQPIFKEFRNRVQASLFPGQKVDSDAPLDDYYYYSDKQLLMKMIQETSLDLSIGEISLEDLRKQLEAYSVDFSPKIIQHLHLIKGNTFAELLSAGVEVVKRAYGSEEKKLTGFKVTWATEFMLHILDKFSNARVIHIVRDPRAVCASRNVRADGKYPWLFLTRQWRKLVTLAWKYTQREYKYNNRNLLLKYENVVNNPKQAVNQICNFLGLDFCDRMLKPESFLDGAGQPWIQNTSYKNAKREFNLESIDKWETVLTSKQVAFIESVCFTEMLAFGYPFAQVTRTGISPSMVYNPPGLVKDQLVNWIRPYAAVDKKSVLREMALEQWRSTVLLDSNNVSDEIKRALCLDPDFFDEARRLGRKYQAEIS